MAMPRAFSTLGCPEATLEEALALADRHAIELVEIRTLAGTADLPAHFAARYGSPRALARRLGAAAARIVAVDSSLRLAGGTEADRRAFLDLAPWAEALGVRWLRVFDGAAPGGVTAMAAALAWWREERAARGWAADVLIETHDTLLTAAAALELLSAAPDAALLWDSHHTWRKGGEDPVATWRALRPRIVHLHVKDSARAPGGGFRLTLPGSGEFPMRALRSALEGSYRGALCLEWERHWHPDLAPLPRALESAAAGWW